MAVIGDAGEDKTAAKKISELKPSIIFPVR
jgi:hypothetical protein